MRPDRSQIPGHGYDFHRSNHQVSTFPGRANVNRKPAKANNVFAVYSGFIVPSLKSLWRSFWVIPIRFYQLVISPWLPKSCIYTPTCSQYAHQSIMKHGLLRGMAIAALRIGRCAGGLYCGGPDPVPETIRWKEIFYEYKKRWCRSKT
ncbi:MAG: membrane protein insertion efficiency factor YidD [Spirochaetaceae bacterium]|nr:MAG: membrane protein insertion efficiency factor YidD [Spirochaetaceae bacterium]